MAENCKTCNRPIVQKKMGRRREYCAPADGADVSACMVVGQDMERLMRSVAAIDFPPTPEGVEAANHLRRELFHLVNAMAEKGRDADGKRYKPPPKEQVSLFPTARRPAGR